MATVNDIGPPDLSHDNLCDKGSDDGVALCGLLVWGLVCGPHVLERQREGQPYQVHARGEPSLAPLLPPHSEWTLCQNLSLRVGSEPGPSGDKA